MTPSMTQLAIAGWAEKCPGSACTDLGLTSRDLLFAARPSANVRGDLM